MASLKFNSVFEFKKNLVILALGPHADDIELGCGATLLYLKKQFKATIHYVVFCDHFTKPHFVTRKQETEESSKMIGSKTFTCLGFEDGDFPNQWKVIQERIANLRDHHKPNLIFVPRLDDNHQDHVIVAEAAKREFRHGQALWHYEIKQFGQDQFQPNIFIDVSGQPGRHDKEYEQFLKNTNGKNTFAHRKVFILRKCMISQIKKPFFHPELLLGTMRFRGMQVSPQVAYAEAFKGRTLI